LRWQLALAGRLIAHRGLFEGALKRESKEGSMGCIMDNTKANRSAMRRLEETYPTWICLGCNAHALNLLMKDLAPDKHPAIAIIFSDIQMIGLVCGDREPIRSYLQFEQNKIWKRTKSISQHCPTRWAIPQLKANAARDSDDEGSDDDIHSVLSVFVCVILKEVQFVFFL
jgi:hypothetical protein